MHGPLDTENNHTDRHPDSTPKPYWTFTGLEADELLKWWRARGHLAASKSQPRAFCPIPEHGLIDFGLRCRQAWLEGWDAQMRRQAKT